MTSRLVFRVAARCVLVAASVVGFLGLSGPAAAQDATVQQRFAAHLAAGEFAPAMAMALGAPDVQQRDALLERLAAAQAQAGARAAALRTAAEIYDDQLRAAALRGIRAEPVGGRGGGTEPDFDSLIELITSTIQPQTWVDMGGPGSVAPFPTGVYVDAQGTLRPLVIEAPAALNTLRLEAAVRRQHEHVRRESPLRKVSLTRLEKQVQLRLAAGQWPTETMQVLAGLQRVRYVFVYPETGDLVLAGPAGDWTTGPEGHLVGLQSGQPVVRLEDLVVVLRAVFGPGDGRFGCLITPRQENLARLRVFLEESTRRPLRPGERPAWLARLRSTLGKQDIEVYGLDPRTRAARVLVEADYRMKLVGMGLEEGVPGVQSYLDSIQLGPGQQPPAMDVLRWWFTLDYEAVRASADRRAFEILGQGVKVLSENEFLTAQGQRVHTGQSDDLNRKFAESFTEHFAQLAAKYPIYAELRNICDLALVAALIRTHGLAEQVGWHLTCFGPGGDYAPRLGAAPKEVDTVINHRVIDRVHVIAGVSGGVRVDPGPLASEGALQSDSDSRLDRQHAEQQAPSLPPDAWWWD